MFGGCCCCTCDCDDDEAPERILRDGASALAGNSEFMPALAAALSAAPGGGLAPRGPRTSTHLPPTLTFRSVDSAESSASSMGPSRCRGASLTQEQMTHEVEQLQSMIRDFVKEILQGVALDVMVGDGSLVPCQCRMDDRLTVIALQVRATTWRIRLADVQDIFSGKEFRPICTETPLDDHCVSLVMSNSQCVTFKFGDVAAREHFSTCMKVLRLAME